MRMTVAVGMPMAVAAEAIQSPVVAAVVMLQGPQLAIGTLQPRQV